MYLFLGFGISHRASNQLPNSKYSEHPFAIDKAYAKQLVNKIDVFEKHFSSKKQIFLSMITTAGLKPSI